MSYYEDTYGGHEPTEDDYCHMEGHLPLFDDRDPEGWETCHCRLVVVPPFNEPHDEYSAYHSELREEYITLVLNSQNQSADFFATSVDQKHRVRNLHRNLIELSLDEMMELLAIIKASTPQYFDHAKSVRDLLAIGTYLDSNGDAIIGTLVRDLIKDTDLVEKAFWKPTTAYSAFLIYDEHRRIARTAALFYTKLTVPSSDWDDAKAVQKLIADICRDLDKNPEKAQAVADLVNAKGASDATTEIALAILNGNLESVAPSITSGLL